MIHVFLERIFVQEFEEAGADAHGDSHDDALADPIDGVPLAMVGRLKQVVRCLLKLKGKWWYSITCLPGILCIPKFALIRTNGLVRM